MLENENNTNTVSTVNTVEPNKNMIDFSNVIGCTEGLSQILSVLYVFINKRDEWKEYLQSINDVSANAILLNGLPGTGKTSIIRNVESSLKNNPELDVRFCESSMFQGQVGNNAIKIESVFNDIRQSNKKASILLIDEIDGLMMKKTGLLNVQERTNAFQAELDGMKDSTNLIVIGTTNHIDNLEPAAKDRFTIIDVYPPNKSDRVEFINKYIAKIKFDCELNLAACADYTEGLTGRNFVQISKKLKMHELRNGVVPATMLMMEFSKYAHRAGYVKTIIKEPSPLLYEDARLTGFNDGD